MTLEPKTETSSSASPEGTLWRLEIQYEATLRFTVHLDRVTGILCPF